MRPTMLNGIPADILAPNKSREEVAAKHLSFDGEPGNLAEGIAALSRLFSKVTV